MSQNSSLQSQTSAFLLKRSLLGALSLSLPRSFIISALEIFNLAQQATLADTPDKHFCEAILSKEKRNSEGKKEREANQFSIYVIKNIVPKFSSNHCSSHSSVIVTFPKLLIAFWTGLNSRFHFISSSKLPTLRQLEPSSSFLYGWTVTLLTQLQCIVLYCITHN